jgi:hypothetical protein
VEPPDTTRSAVRRVSCVPDTFTDPDTKPSGTAVPPGTVTVTVVE